MWSFRNPGPWQRATQELYRDVLDEVVAAEALGYDSAWVTEHHFVDDGYLPAVMPALAAMAARTSRIRLGPYAAVLPLHHPVRFAEDAAVIDIISDGRLELALAVGYRKTEFEAMEIDWASRGALQSEAVEILLGAWKDHPLQHFGRAFHCSGVDVMPKPIQRPIPIYLAGTAPPVLDRVARLGVSGVAGRPRRRDMPRFHDALATHGRSPADVQYLPVVFLWVDRRSIEARRVSRPWAEYMFKQYRSWFTAAGMPLRGLAIDDGFITGNPTECIEQLERFLAAGSHAPATRLVIQPPLLGVDHRASMQMMETFATEVAPHFADR